MSDKYYIRGFDTFDHDKNKRRQAYNRLITYISAIKDIGLSKAGDYLLQFDDESKKNIKAIKDDINARGLNAIKREITEG